MVDQITSPTVATLGTSTARKGPSGTNTFTLTRSVRVTLTSFAVAGIGMLLIRFASTLTGAVAGSGGTTAGSKSNSASVFSNLMVLTLLFLAASSCASFCFLSCSCCCVAGDLSLAAAAVARADSLVSAMSSERDKYCLRGAGGECDRMVLDMGSLSTSLYTLTL